MDEVIDKYNQTAEQYAKSRIGTEDKDELDKFKSMLTAGDKVLDVGCAAGRDTNILKNMGFNAVGADLAEKLLDIAKKTYPDIKFVLADMRKLPFDDGSFNAIWASAVLHHVSKSEMLGVLKEFRRVLNPGGLLYVHTKAGQGVLRTNENGVMGKTREFELVTGEELDSMLQEAGYKKVSLQIKASKSRPGLYWVSAFYKKI